MHKRVERPGALDLAQAGLGQLNRGDIALAQGIAGLRNREFVEISHYSTTFGTAKKPSRASGALAKTLAC
jgi:hypothetical protein